MINKKLKKIIDIEDKDILKGLLIDLMQIDIKNEQRVEELLMKYE